VDGVPVNLLVFKPLEFEGFKIGIFTNTNNLTSTEKGLFLLKVSYQLAQFEL